VRASTISYLHIVLGLAVFALSVLSMSVGAESIDVLTSITRIFSDRDDVGAIIMREVRLPRTLIAIIAGATLGLCGAAMQGLLRNPLASPGLVGSASGAALGAVTILYFGAGAFHPQSVPIAGMLGSLLATAIVYLLAGRDSNVTTLILAGVAVNAMATAGMSSQSLGVHNGRLRWRVFIAVSLAVGASVATTGMIGFIGLVVPHLLRPFVGYEPRRLLWVSALGGSAMLLAADIGVRLIPTPTVLKVGVLTSIVGAPFFLHLILRSRRDGYR